jgi:hypothetical protein
MLIDIMPDGKVLTNGEHLFTIDRAGRVYEPDNDPVAVLQADGRLLGRDDLSLGRVGLRNSSPGTREFAWLSIGDRGEVTHFAPDGQPSPDGAWTGCGPALRTCTLTTHIVSLIETRMSQTRMPGPHVGIGFGLGLGMGVHP